jgi:hypothetical protein
LWRKVAQTKNRFNFGDARIVVDNGAVCSLVRCHVLQHGGIGDEQSLILAAPPALSIHIFPYPAEIIDPISAKGFYATILCGSCLRQICASVENAVDGLAVSKSGVSRCGK